MKKFRIQLVAVLAACCSLGMVSCDNEEFSSVEYAEVPTMKRTTMEETTMDASKVQTRVATGDGTSVGTNEIINIGTTNTWIGEPSMRTYTKQKVLMSAATPMGTAGIYICDVVEISATTDTNSNLVYLGVVDNECGYTPNTIDDSSPVIGTQAIHNAVSNNYTLKTICYRIISNTAGIQYPSNYWIPCPPEQAKLKYQVIVLN